MERIESPLFPCEPLTGYLHLLYVFQPWKLLPKTAFTRITCRYMGKAKLFMAMQSIINFRSCMWEKLFCATYLNEKILKGLLKHISNQSTSNGLAEKRIKENKGRGTEEGMKEWKSEILINTGITFQTQGCPSHSLWKSVTGRSAHHSCVSLRAEKKASRFTHVGICCLYTPSRAAVQKVNNEPTSHNTFRMHLPN